MSEVWCGWGPTHSRAVGVPCRRRSRSVSTETGSLTQRGLMPCMMIRARMSTVMRMAMIILVSILGWRVRVCACVCVCVCVYVCVSIWCVWRRTHMRTHARPLIHTHESRLEPPCLSLALRP